MTVDNCQKNISKVDKGVVKIQKQEQKRQEETKGMKENKKQEENEKKEIKIRWITWKIKK